MALPHDFVRDFDARQVTRNGNKPNLMPQKLVSMLMHNHIWLGARRFAPMEIIKCAQCP
jgi:hypothetical protein